MDVSSTLVELTLINVISKGNLGLAVIKTVTAVTRTVILYLTN